MGGIDCLDEGLPETERCCGCPDITNHLTLHISFDMAWVPCGKNHTGLIQASTDAGATCTPAIATHLGEIWCLWRDSVGELFFAVGDNNTFQIRNPFPDKGVPVMAELCGKLHVAISRDSGDIFHYIFDDENQQWLQSSQLSRNSGLWTKTIHALRAFHNKLFLVFLQNEILYYSTCVVTLQSTSVWTMPQEVSGIRRIKGEPALFVLNETLHVLCVSKDSNEVLTYAYASLADVWNSSNDISVGQAAQGFSATSYGSSAFLAFQEDKQVFMSEFKDGRWSAPEAVAEQTSADLPQLVVLNGRINCFFNADGHKIEIMWYSRSLLNYSLSSWMAKIPDSTPLSRMSIPGTHDSCARANIPFVRTQYLSITKQLESGIRFLDLRLRVHGDGDLYCYHGGVPMNFPFYLKFDSVMQEIFDFLESVSSTPTETVLVSINNDDSKHREPADNTIFYNAVKLHIEANREKWITSSTTVPLGMARGKAVLLRRYRPDPLIAPLERMGIDLSRWKNNNPDFTIVTPDGVKVTLQDHWHYIDPVPLTDLVSSKYGYVSEMLYKASENMDPQHWFLNFASAVGDPRKHGEVAESHSIAVGARSDYVGGQFVKGVNPTLKEDYRFLPGKRYGILAMDYPEQPKDSDLVAKLIETNWTS